MCYFAFFLLHFTLFLVHFTALSAVFSILFHTFSILFPLLSSLFPSLFLFLLSIVDGTLFYYRSSNDIRSGSRGTVCLADAKITFDPSRGRSFTVQSANDTYQFRADSSETRSEWLKHIRAAKGSIVESAESLPDGGADVRFWFCWSFFWFFLCCFWLFLVVFGLFCVFFRLFLVLF